MSGQMILDREKQTMIDEFIKNNNPYSPLEPLNFDLRSYEQYIKNNNISDQKQCDSLAELFTIH